MSTLTRPAWATRTIEPDRRGDFGVHQATVTVGNVTIGVDQVIDLDSSSPEPVFADLNNVNVDADWDAQDCRDLAAALLKAAEIIDNA